MEDQTLLNETGALPQEELPKNPKKKKHIGTYIVLVLAILIVAFIKLFLKNIKNYIKR